MRAAPTVRQLVAQASLMRTDPVELVMAWQRFKPDIGLTDDQWVAVLRAKGYRSDGRPAEPPAAPVTLYRGAPDRFGMSWSGDRETAQGFATLQHTALWQAIVAPAYLLAYMSAQAEYIVDPAGLSESNVWPADEAPPTPLVPPEPPAALPPRDRSALPSGLPRSMPLELHQLYAQANAVLRKSGH